MSHLFSRTPSVGIQRSAFDRSHTYKTTFYASRLYPIFLDEVLPGDTFNLKVSLFCRMATPIVPILDNLYLETFFFFVPDRLVWDNFQKFMGEQEDPGDSIDFLIPNPAVPDDAVIEEGSLGDYFGLPVGISNIANDISALPMRCYYTIWNEFFRDQNLQDSIKVAKGDSAVTVNGAMTNGYKLWYKSGSALPRGKRHDYFTACLPSPQRFEAMALPLTGNAPVYGNGNAINLLIGGTSDNPSYRSRGVLYNGPLGGADDTVSVANGLVDVNLFDGSFDSGNISRLNGYHPLGLINKSTAETLDVSSGLYADMSGVASATINDLRTAFQIQRLLESQNRSGTRYTEILRGQFSVISPDARLQRPEFLGGSSARISINPVQQTSGTSASSETPQGNLAAYGVCADRFNGFVKSFVEHGYIIGLCNVRADLNYQQGINRMWSRKTRYDFYWPTLAHLGEQAVLNKEIYAQGNDDDDKVFGYQERWSEYRYFPNQITGKMRSTDPQSLDIWHLAQKFDSLPKLNREFIEDNAPVERVIAVPSEPQFLLDAYFKMKCVRPMPVYSIPGLIDHF